MASAQTGPIRMIRVDDWRPFRDAGTLFGSPAQVMSELLERAWRAGATELQVDVQGHTLTLRDDRPGLAAPGTFFSEARRGNDEGVMADLARIGLLGLSTVIDCLEVTSRPAAAGPAWRATIPANVIAGGSVVLSELSGTGAPGLQVRLALKPEAAMPDLLHPSWRHRYPLEVRVSVQGAEPVTVAPEIPEGEEWLPTPLGRVRLLPNPPASPDVSCAVWEHRVLRFYLPGERVTRQLKQRMPRTLAGLFLGSLLDEAALEWEMDPELSELVRGPRPMTHVHGGEALERTLDVIAGALLARVDEVRLRREAEAVTGTAAITPLSRAPVALRGVLGALGGAVPTDAVLPFLGYVRAQRAEPVETVEVWVDVVADEAETNWTGAVSPVWVRPRYRTHSQEAALLALAEGIPAVHREAGGDDPLPLLVTEADRLVAARSIGHVFAHGLRFVAGGEVLGPVRHALGRSMTEGSVHRALSPRWGAAVESLHLSRRPLPHVDGVSGRAEIPERWAGLHPLDDGVRVIDYVRTSPRFARLAARECDHHGAWPVAFWEYVDVPGQRVDEDGLVRALADLLAEELGPSTAAAVRRETRALQLAADCGSLLDSLRRTLISRPALVDGERRDVSPLGEARVRWGLDPELLGRLEDVATSLCELLELVSAEQLLRPAPAQAA